MSTTKLSPAQLVEAVGQLTVLEAAEFVKLAEEKFGVKAAAAAPVAAAGHAGPAAGGRVSASQGKRSSIRDRSSRPGFRPPGRRAGRSRAWCAGRGAWCGA